MQHHNMARKHRCMHWVKGINFWRTTLSETMEIDKIHCVCMLNSGWRGLRKWKIYSWCFPTQEWVSGNVSMFFQYTLPWIFLFISFDPYCFVSEYNLCLSDMQMFNCDSLSLSPPFTNLASFLSPDLNSLLPMVDLEDFLSPLPEPSFSGTVIPWEFPKNLF